MFFLLAPEPSRVVPDIADVLHVVSAVRFGALSLSNVLCVSCCVDRQDLGLAVVRLSKAEPRCICSVLGSKYGVKNAQFATKAAVYLKEQYPRAEADRATCSIVQALAFCTRGCANAPPFRRQAPRGHEGGGCAPQQAPR